MNGSKRNLSWLVPFGLLVTAIIAVPLRMLEPQGLPRYQLLKKELGEVKRQNVRLRNEVRSLSRSVRALREDPKAVEQIARDELGMVRPNEIVFQFADAP